MAEPHPRKTARAGGDQRGQIMVEYLALLLIAGIGLVLVVGPELGPRIVGEYTKRRTLMYSPYP